MYSEFCISKREKNIILSGENVSVRIKHAILQVLQVKRLGVQLPPPSISFDIPCLDILLALSRLIAFISITLSHVIAIFVKITINVRYYKNYNSLPVNKLFYSLRNQDCIYNTNEQVGVLHVKRASPYRKETNVTLHEDVVCLTRQIFAIIGRDEKPICGYNRVSHKIQSYLINHGIVNLSRLFVATLAVLYDCAQIPKASLRCMEAISKSAAANVCS